MRFLLTLLLLPLLRSSTFLTRRKQPSFLSPHFFLSGLIPLSHPLLRVRASMDGIMVALPKPPPPTIRFQTTMKRMPLAPPSPTEMFPLDPSDPAGVWNHAMPILRLQAVNTHSVPGTRPRMKASTRPYFSTPMQYINLSCYLSQHIPTGFTRL